MEGEAASKGKHVEHKLLAEAYRVIKTGCKRSRKHVKGKKVYYKKRKILTVFTLVPDPALGRPGGY